MKQSADQTKSETKQLPKPHKMSQPLLEIEDLTIQYSTPGGELTAVSDLSITISRGEYFGLVGESGCGKSTVANALVGGLPDNGYVSSGEIRYDRMPLHDMTQEELNDKVRWKEIAYIPQQAMNSLNPVQKISAQATEIAQTHTEMTEAEIRSDLQELFEIVGIQADRIDNYPHQFSGGMAQRAIIAMALLLNPSLIIADEPTTALDVIMQDQVFKYLDEIQEDVKTSMVLITHDISVVLEACESIGVMHSGQLAEVGKTTELYDNPTHPYTIILQQAFPDHRFPDRDLKTIKGHPPQNMGDVNYCTFDDRCPLATEECREHAPPLEPVDDQENSYHKAACIHRDQSDDLRRSADQQTEGT